jgi:glycosyltransferase involved in cell wall biosynthesis
MKREADRHLKTRSIVRPFIGSEHRSRHEPQARESGGRHHDFVYVSSGEQHKNHRTLLHAWALLADRGCRPSLCLTLDPTQFPDLVKWIERHSRENDLNVLNIGAVGFDEIHALYVKSKALIYPSLFESFGLPLLEATQAGLPVIAGELDYVRDLIEPSQTFDPTSAVSIARAVERHLGIPGRQVHPSTPEEFIDDIFQDRAMI